jgi:hypothetical protein
MVKVVRDMKRKQDKGVTIEFINTLPVGAIFKRDMFKALVELAKLNNADRVLVVFDRDNAARKSAKP